MRVSEACAAEVVDLGVERAHRVLAVIGKGGQRTLVPLAPRTVRAIDAALGGRTDGPLLVSNTGGRLDRHDAARIVARLARRAGLTKHITPHSLRHTMVTLALDAGVSLRDVQDAARHADLYFGGVHRRSVALPHMRGPTLPAFRILLSRLRRDAGGQVGQTPTDEPRPVLRVRGQTRR